MLIRVVNLILLVLTFSVPLQAQTTSKNIDQLLSLPPAIGPLEVRASFHLHDINYINDEQENFEFTGVLVLTWVDKRQAFDPKNDLVYEKIYQGGFQFDEVSPAWYPQVVLKNESGLFEKHGTLLRIRPDGTSILTETINASAEVDLDMSKHPFDTHNLKAEFEILGFDSQEVLIIANENPIATAEPKLKISQWILKKLSSNSIIIDTPYAGKTGKASNFIVNFELQRNSFFMLRLVVVPLAIIVVLSWCVFWMDRSSLGDRINVSFIGILTAVAYQIVISDKLPHISYVTLINAFVNISFLMMSAAVVVNLIVGNYDKRGMSEKGDLLDKRCRIIFPTVYFCLIFIITLFALLIL